mmetsp:Transcript_2882/g.7916  ORF Transcript_2882/g.7916 Transcript_2882/m.7916 type:complete len:605 (+) Transcript_2882:82-1896(+)
MYNPIVRKIVERNMMSEESSRHHEETSDGRVDDNVNEILNSSTNNMISLTEDVAPSSRNLSSVTIAVNNSNTTGTSLSVNMEDKNSSQVDICDTEQSIDSIREYDVLMGRGSGPNRHSGNIHFRAIVGEVFDDFLSKHGTETSMICNNGTEMLRIDPSTKNRLAQAVLDKITLEKKGRFLQKLNKNEFLDVVQKGDDSTLIKARALTIMDSAMPATSSTMGFNTDGKADSSNLKVGPGAVVYYKIIPEKQILAKIKQTFRFLRDQNEQLNAIKQRQRARHIAAVAAGHGVVSQEQRSFSATPLGVLGNFQVPGAVVNAATYALMGRLGANAGIGIGNPVNALNVNPTSLPDQLNFANNTNANRNNSVNTSNSQALWSATRSLRNIMAPPTKSMTFSAIKNSRTTNPPTGAMDFSAVASRLLCDLPQPKRVLPTPEAPTASSLLQKSALAAAVSQLDKNSNGNNFTSIINNPTKRLLEELTLSRLANLQKQRDDTINAYLAMERSSSGNQGSSRIGNAVSQVDGVCVTPPPVPSQQLQRLMNLNSSSPSPLPLTTSGNAAALGGLKSSSSESLSLLLQLSRKKSMNNTNMALTSRSHSLHAFSSF